MIVKFKQFINEALGVPNGADEGGEIIYNKFITSFKKEFKKNFLIDNILVGGDEADFEYYMHLNLSIGDLVIHGCQVELNIKGLDNTNTIEISSLGVYNKTEYIDSVDKIKHHTETTVEISIEIICDKNKYTNDLINYLEEEEKKNEIISAISHELMHVYDHFKNDEIPADKFSVDTTYTKLANESYFNIKCVKRLFYNLYYVSNAETVTRNTEVASLLRSNKVDKKNFESFLKQTKTYKDLLEIKNFSFSKFKEELKNSEKEIDDHFKYNDMKDKLNLSIDEKVKVILNDIKKIIDGTALIRYKDLMTPSMKEILSKANLDNYKDLMDINPEDLLKIPDDKLRKIKKLRDKQEYRKNDINYYFGKMENIFHKKAEYANRKLTKLFDKVE